MYLSTEYDAIQRCHLFHFGALFYMVALSRHHYDIAEYIFRQTKEEMTATWSDYQHEDSVKQWFTNIINIYVMFLQYPDWKSNTSARPSDSWKSSTSAQPSDSWKSEEGLNIILESMKSLTDSNFNTYQIYGEKFKNLLMKHDYIDLANVINIS